jgi:homoserine kinase type II
MDDADGGRRGLRARPGPGLLQALQDRWGLGPPAELVDLGGSFSLNLLVDDGDERYVVRVHRPHVTPARLDAIQQARAALLAGGVPCAPPVATLRGAPWIEVEGRLVEVEAYVDHDAVMDSWERLEVGMALLAQTHNLLRYMEVGAEGRRPWFANHLDPADVASSVRRGVERIRGWGPTAAERRLAAAAEELAELVTQAEGGLDAALPRQLGPRRLLGQQRAVPRRPASRCRRSAGGSPAWTTRRPRAATPPVSDPSSRRRGGS